MPERSLTLSQKIVLRRYLRTRLKESQPDDKTRIARILESREMFQALADHVAEKYEAADDDSFWDNLQRFLEWLLEHKEEIILLVKLVISLFDET